MEETYIFIKPWYLNTQMFKAGDTIKVKFFNDHRLGHCSVKGDNFYNEIRSDYFRFLLGRKIVKV